MLADRRGPHLPVSSLTRIHSGQHPRPSHKVHTGTHRQLERQNDLWGRIEILSMSVQEALGPLILCLPIISPTSAKVTSGEKIWPPLPTAIVWVTGLDVLDELAAYVASARGALDVIVEESPNEIASWPTARATKAVSAATLCIILVEGALGRVNRRWKVKMRAGQTRVQGEEEEVKVPSRAQMPSDQGLSYHCFLRCCARLQRRDKGSHPQHFPASCLQPGLSGGVWLETDGPGQELPKRHGGNDILGLALFGMKQSHRGHRGGQNSLRGMLAGRDVGQRGEAERVHGPRTSMIGLQQ